MVERGAPGQKTVQILNPPEGHILPGQGIPKEKGVPRGEGVPKEKGRLPGSEGQLSPGNPGQMHKGSPGQVDRGAPGQMDPWAENPWEAPEDLSADWKPPPPLDTDTPVELDASEFYAQHPNFMGADLDEEEDDEF